MEFAWEKNVMEKNNLDLPIIDDLDDFVNRFLETYRISEEAGMALHPEDYTEDDREELEREITGWLSEYFIIKKAFLRDYLKKSGG